MAQHHEPWLTALFNDHLAGLGNFFLGLVGEHAHDPARPWTVPVTMEILATVLVMILIAMVRSRLSMDKPGGLQHIFEIMHRFLHDQAEDQIGHHSAKFVPFAGTIFLFILVMNLLGTIPTLESPTMFPEVPLGFALASFGFYHFSGVREFGLGKYLGHFAGPMPLMAPLMVPIEIISHLSRPLSLTVRLFANMYAGEQVTLVFLGLTYVIAPVAFMGLHIFVSLLQAYIFALLTLLYVAGAVAHDH